MKTYSLADYIAHMVFYEDLAELGILKKMITETIDQMYADMHTSRRNLSPEQWQLYVQSKQLKTDVFWGIETTIQIISDRIFEEALK